MREKIDIHAHYFPPAYDQMLEKRGMKLLDGGFPKPEWNEEIQLSFMEKLGITYSVLSISSPHLHMGDVGEAIEVARSSNEYGAELMKKYPEQIGVLASLPLPEIDAAVEEVKYCRNDAACDRICLTDQFLRIVSGGCETGSGDGSLESGRISGADPSDGTGSNSAGG